MPEEDVAAHAQPVLRGEVDRLVRALEVEDPRRGRERSPLELVLAGDRREVRPYELTNLRARPAGLFGSRADEASGFRRGLPERALGAAIRAKAR